MRSPVKRPDLEKRDQKTRSRRSSPMRSPVDGGGWGCGEIPTIRSGSFKNGGEIWFDPDWEWVNLEDDRGLGVNEEEPDLDSRSRFQ